MSERRDEATRVAEDLAWDRKDEGRFRGWAESHGVDPEQATREEVKDAARVFVREEGDQFTEATGDPEAGF